MDWMSVLYAAGVFGVDLKSQDVIITVMNRAIEPNGKSPDHFYRSPGKSIDAHREQNLWNMPCYRKIDR